VAAASRPHWSDDGLHEIDARFDAFIDKLDLFGDAP